VTCFRCRADNSPGRRFCGECGAPLAVPCGSCGFSNEPGIKFCGGCGAPLGAVPATATPKFASPDAYTPKHLAEKILTSKAALEGERKQVTVLFADLKGSMELLADRDPEEARKILDPVLERMMEAVHRYEGTVNQVMGDGVMALFGAPLAHEDHGVRACYAALRMQEAVKQYADELRKSEGVPIRIRVGLNSGEVVVRAIGSDLHMDYTAVGQTTHLAARMEQLADPGAILLTPDTLALAEGFVQVRSLGPTAVKGLSAPVEVFELTGVSAVRSRLHAAAARGLTRFVGRDAEMEQLHRSLEQARLGRGQIAAVVGEPGVGKSRLFFELTRSHRVEGWTVLEAGSVSYGKATSYLPVIDLLQGYFKISDRDTQRHIREKVIGKILAMDRALEPTIPALLALLDVPVEDREWQALDPAQRRQRTLNAVKRLLLREAHAQPTLAVFEDLHWIDSETQALLEALVDSLPTARLLLLVNYRPEYQHGWGNKTYYTQIRLDALPEETAGELLEGLLGLDPSVDALKRMLAGRTGGNPFFLEESVRALAETKVLVGERGGYRLAQLLETVRVPATVQAILAARIDRLPPDEKRLLETAAAIGKEFPWALLLAVSDSTEEVLRRGLGHLQTAEFVYETSLFPDLEYTFKHALTHDVAYGSLLHDRRRGLHVAIVEGIEKIHAARLTEQVETLAYHALRGELWDRAATYAHQAGVKAAGHSAYPEAIGSFEGALAAVERLPETPATLVQGIDVRLDLRNALWPSGQLRRGLEHLQAARPLAERLGERKWVGRLWAHMSAAHWLIGDNTSALDAGQRALAIGTELNDFRIQVDARNCLGTIAHSLGDHERSSALLGANMAALSGQALTGRFGSYYAVNARTWLVWGMALRGQFDEADSMAQEGLRLAEAAGYPADIAGAMWSLGYSRLQRGDLGSAVVILERAHAMVNDTSTIVWWGPTQGCLGYACALHGDIDRGARLLEAVTEPGAIESQIGMCELLACLAEVYLLGGRFEEADRAAQRGLALSRQRGERGAQALTLRALAEVAARRGPNEPQAVQFFGEALALADASVMRPLVAHCHLGLGKLHRRTGKREQAREHLTTATTMYREMDMRFWLEQAEGEVRALA
jgi:class 3 adenylate cyclase/tetratricopeptide (TPR) repeat protein